MVHYWSQTIWHSFSQHMLTSRPIIHDLKTPTFSGSLSFPKSRALHCPKLARNMITTSSSSTFVWSLAFPILSHVETEPNGKWGLYYGPPAGGCRWIWSAIENPVLSETWGHSQANWHGVQSMEYGRTIRSPNHPDLNRNTRFPNMIDRLML